MKNADMLGEMPLVLSADVVVHGLAKYSSYVQGEVRQRITRMLADRIASDFIVHEEGDLHDTYMGRLYVCSPHQLSVLIERRANALRDGVPPRVELLWNANPYER